MGYDPILVLDQNEETFNRMKAKYVEMVNRKQQQKIEIIDSLNKMELLIEEVDVHLETLNIKAYKTIKNCELILTDLAKAKIDSLKTTPI